jgi:dipeptidase E
MKLILASSLNDALFGKILHHLPKPLAASKVICIPTAANVYLPENRAWQTEEMDVLRRAGATLDVFDIAGKNPQQVAQKLEQADIVYATGGNAFYLLEHMQRSGVAGALKALFKRGGTYIGTSAGAVVACEDIDYIAPMDEPHLAKLTSTKGLGLVPYLIVPHTHHPKFDPQARQIFAKPPIGHHLLGLTDHQALLVTDSVTEVVQA